MRLTLAVSRAKSRSEARAEAVGVGSSAWLGWVGVHEAVVPPAHPLLTGPVLAPPTVEAIAWWTIDDDPRSPRRVPDALARSHDGLQWVALNGCNGLPS